MGKGWALPSSNAGKTRACATSRDPVVRSLVRPEVTFPSAVTMTAWGYPRQTPLRQRGDFSALPEALVRLRELLDSRPFTLRASSGPAFEAPGVHDGTLWESLEVASSRRGAKMSALPSPP